MPGVGAITAITITPIYFPTGIRMNVVRLNFGESSTGSS
jgi:hypothetical protein